LARSLRIERENGVYHVINRGNYSRDLFINEGAHLSFEKCLFEACEKCGWILEGYYVMTNHHHLVIRTPRSNLVYGMKWLQSTFANRYHRFRKQLKGAQCFMIFESLVALSNQRHNATASINPQSTVPSHRPLTAPPPRARLDFAAEAVSAPNDVIAVSASRLARSR
jgi:REP element-mobilizing transposase RayT